jgi:rod shape-determining protein MreC
MRTLLKFLQKYSNFLLFLLLETFAIWFLVQGSNYQRSRIVGLNRQISGYLFSKVDGARAYLSLREANLELVEENVKLRNRIDRMELLMDSAIVRSEFRDPYHFQYVPCRVVHNSVYKQYNYMTLDKGRKQGVSNNFATVIPVINRDFRLSVKLRSNNYAGILQWEGESPLFAVLNEIPFHVDLVLHDTIVTSGFSTIFPEGIDVGTIDSFSLDKGNFYEIRVRLSTDVQKLFNVNVIRNFKQDEQLNLEQQTR